MEGPPCGGSWCAWHVAGPAPTPETAAESLRRAGAVRGDDPRHQPGMGYVNFSSAPTPPTPHRSPGAKLIHATQRSSDRYLTPTEESRDFFSVSTI